MTAEEWRMKMSEFAETVHTVAQEDLASVMKSGSLPVLATPRMIAWMEEAACLCVEAPEGLTSVGIEMNASHDAPSPLEAEIVTKARLLETKGKILSFEIESWMGEKQIGKASHKRALVNEKKFLSKIYPE